MIYRPAAGMKVRFAHLKGFPAGFHNGLGCAVSEKNPVKAFVDLPKFFKSKAEGRYLHIERREIYHAPAGRISFIICRRHISFQHMYPRREPEAGENPGVTGSAAAVVVAAAAPAAAAAAVVAGVGAPSAAADEEKDDDQDPAAVTVVTTHIAVPPFG